jgi:ankyrin repeat protein
MTTFTTRVIGCVITVLGLVSGVFAHGDLRLVDAVKRQDKDAVRTLLQSQLDVNATQGGGATALHWAAHWDDLETANRLLTAGANVNAFTDLGVTPLYLASEIGSASMAETLLAAGANPNLTAETGVSPLMLAARAGASKTVHSLLSYGANINATQRSSGQTALMWAVAQGHPGVVQVLAAHGADMHARSRTSRQLVNKGGVGDGDTTFVDWINVGGSTALLFAARHGHVQSARILLDHAAHVDDTMADGNSALVVAAHSGHGAVAALLLERGANPNARGAGYTVLHAAVLRGDLSLLKTSLAHGANPNAKLLGGTPFRRSGPDYFFPASLAGATPLFLAANYGDVAMIHALANAGANEQETTHDGTTPLMIAADSDRRRQAVLTYARPQDVVVANAREGLEAVSVLLELGANINVANKNGNTALHIAAGAHSSQIVRLLAENGAALNQTNSRGQTPLTVATSRRRTSAAAVSTAELLRTLGAEE